MDCNTFDFKLSIYFLQIIIPTTWVVSSVAQMT